jgi:hypothetical protein
LTVGVHTIVRWWPAIVRRASIAGIPAAFNGLLASKMRLPASSSDSGAVATAIASTSLRR